MPKTSERSVDSRMTPISQRSRDSQSNAVKEFKQAKDRAMKNSAHRSPPKLDASGNSGKWERYAPSETSVSMMSYGSRDPGRRAQSACSGSRRSSDEGSRYADRRRMAVGGRGRGGGGYGGGTPIPESVCSSAVGSLYDERRAGGSALGSQAGSSVQGRKRGDVQNAPSDIGSVQSGKPPSKGSGSMVSDAGGSQQRPATAPSGSGSYRSGSEAPSGSYRSGSEAPSGSYSYYTYGSETSSRRNDARELARANMMKQKRQVKTGRVFEGKTQYREQFKPQPIEERIEIPRGLMLHMHPEWAPPESDWINTSTYRVNFAHKPAPDVHPAGSSTALEPTPLICDW